MSWPIVRGTILLAIACFLSGVAGAQAQRGGEDWVFLGSLDIAPGKANDAIDLRSARGRSKALRLIAKSGHIVIDKVTVQYADGRRHDEVRRINERGTTVFLTTQYLEEADQLCNRLAIIDGGRIIREGTPTSLKADLRRRQGLDADPTLDDVFLDATGRSRDRVAGEVKEIR